jgi:FolB domain-containing protein
VSAEGPDRIHIRDLLVRCVVGVYDWERTLRQDVIINITLCADLADACRSDDIEDTVDYKDLNKRIIREVEKTKFQLIERLAEFVAQICLDTPRVEHVRVSVEKPGALRFARSAVVEIERGRGEDGAGLPG